MPWQFTHEDLVAELGTAARHHAESGPGMSISERLGRAHLWLDELEPARTAFAAGATFFKTEMLPRGRGDHAGGWGEYGHLLRLSGDVEAAHAAYRHALTLLTRFDDDLADELRFLLGEPLEDDEGYLAQIARGETESTRKQIVKDIRAQRLMPSSTAPALTAYDLLELTFAEPRPPHAEMLRAAGLLRD
jgi:hypothetical protein